MGCVGESLSFIHKSIADSADCIYRYLSPMRGYDHPEPTEVFHQHNYHHHLNSQEIKQQSDEDAGISLNKSALLCCSFVLLVVDGNGSAFC